VRTSSRTKYKRKKKKTASF